MWVIVKKYFAGTLPCIGACNYPGGQKHELPEKAVEELRKKLGRKNVVDACAPWDEGKDVAAAEREGKVAAAKAAIAKAEAIGRRLEELDRIIDASREDSLRKTEEYDNAREVAEKLAKAAGIEWPSKPKTGKPKSEG